MSCWVLCAPAFPLPPCWCALVSQRLTVECIGTSLVAAVDAVPCWTSIQRFKLIVLLDAAPHAQHVRAQTDWFLMALFWQSTCICIAWMQPQTQTVMLRPEAVQTAEAVNA